MSLLTRYLKFFTAGLFLSLVSGCMTTAINESHSLLAQSSDGDIAKVYFIRPDSGFRGVMGDAFTIILGGKRLLTIANGEYTLVYLNYYSGDVTVESSTVMNQGARNIPVTVKESLPFKFDESKTYYITFKEKERGVRQGTSYIPISITEDDARKLASKLKPVGKAVTAPL